MSKLLRNIKKLGELPLAHSNCDSCIFKVVEFEKEPCLGCVYGKYGGQEDRFVQDESEESGWKD